MSTSDNPFEAPAVDVDPVDGPRSLEAEQRTEHIATEARIRSIGALLIFGAFGPLIAGTVSCVRAVEAGEIDTLLRGFLELGVGVVLVGVGVGLMRFDRRARIVGLGLGGVCLLQPPVLTAFGVYVLFMLLGRKGSMIFSEPYAKVIAATPDIQYQSSMFTRVTLAVLLGVLSYILFLELRPGP